MSVNAVFCSCSSASLPVAVRASDQERRRDCQKPALNGESVSGSQIRVALVAFHWLSCESVWTRVSSIHSVHHFSARSFSFWNVTYFVQRGQHHVSKKQLLGHNCQLADLLFFRVLLPPNSVQLQHVEGSGLFGCFSEPPNSDMDHRIFNVHGIQSHPEEFCSCARMYIWLCTDIVSG